MTSNDAAQTATLLVSCPDRPGLVAALVFSFVRAMTVNGFRVNNPAVTTMVKASSPSVAPE